MTKQLEGYRHPESIMTIPRDVTIPINDFVDEVGHSPNGTLPVDFECEKHAIDGPVKRARFSVHRDALDIQELEKLYSVEHEEEPSVSVKVIKHIRSSCTCTASGIINVLCSFFPVLSWLPHYQFKEFLFNDITAGFTIAILHIPQGMAYGLLASVDAIIGLYVSFFPVLVYFVMGTSRHISLGTFAVISLMLSSTADQLNAVTSRDEDAVFIAGHPNISGIVVAADSIYPFENLENNISTIAQIQASAALQSPIMADVIDWPPTRLEVLTAMCLVTGFWQVLMGAFHLGTLTVVLSDQLVSGFSTGAAVHVATSQLKDLFDIRIRRFNGPFKIVYTYIDIFADLSNSKLATVIVSAIAIFILAIVKEQINGRYGKKLPMPIPIDLIVVVLATFVSYLCDFSGNFHVKVMGNIPTGLPQPTPPRLDLLPKVTMSSLVVAIVAFAISLSMAKIFAKKHKYTVNPNQELFALGSANIISSFFLCYPSAASLSRSVVQERSGCKTQLASVVSCLLLLIVLLVVGPLFYTLPKCILASIILVALKGMFMQVLDLKTAWRISRADAMIWLVTFMSVVLIDVDYGLICGIIFSLLTVLIHSVTPHRTLLGNLPNTDIYLDTKRYKEAKEVAGVKIFHFGAALYFANREVFKAGLSKFLEESQELMLDDKKIAPVHHIIIDCSSFSYLDYAGVETLIEVAKEYGEQSIAVFLAGCSVPVYDRLDSAGYSSKIQQPSIFPTIHDAVLHCQKPVSE